MLPFQRWSHCSPGDVRSQNTVLNDVPFQAHSTNSLPKKWVVDCSMGSLLLEMLSPVCDQAIYKIRLFCVVPPSFCCKGLSRNNSDRRRAEYYRWFRSFKFQKSWRALPRVQRGVLEWFILPSMHVTILRSRLGLHQHYQRRAVDYFSLFPFLHVIRVQVMDFTTHGVI